VTTVSNETHGDYVGEYSGKSRASSFEGEPHFTTQEVRPPRVRAQVEVAERLFPESHVRRRDYISGKVSPCTKHRAKSPRPDSLKSICSSPRPCLHFSVHFVAKRNSTRIPRANLENKNVPWISVFELSDNLLSRLLLASSR